MKAISALRRDININDRRMKTKPLRFAELIEHFRQRARGRQRMEDLINKGHIRGLPKKWIVPRWGATNLAHRAVEDELWLRTLPLAEPVEPRFGI